MNILILGAKGMLGTELGSIFKESSPTLWDFEDLDITDFSGVKEKIISVLPGIIINAVAYNAVDKVETETDKANSINGTAVGNLAKIAKDLGAIFVHYSTDYVFDGEKKEGYVEDDKPRPISAYGKSKLLGEMETAKNTGKYYIIRLSKLFGKSGTGQNVKKSFVDTMLELAKTKEILEIVDEEYSSPTYAPDLAEHTKYIIENGLPFGIYHAANSGACTWYEFAKEIFLQANIKINLIPVSGDRFPRPAKRPAKSVLLNTKLPEMRDWKEALKDYIQFLISNF